MEDCRVAAYLHRRSRERLPAHQRRFVSIRSCGFHVARIRTTTTHTWVQECARLACAPTLPCAARLLHLRPVLPILSSARSGYPMGTRRAFTRLARVVDPARIRPVPHVEASRSVYAGRPFDCLRKSYRCRENRRSVAPRGNIVSDAARCVLMRSGQVRFI